MSSKQKQPTDPRTPQFLDAVLASAVLIGVNFASFRLSGSAVISQNYFYWAVIVLPCLASLVALSLVLNRRWNWGQLIYLMIVALLCSFVQLMILGEASASG